MKALPAVLLLAIALCAFQVGALDDNRNSTQEPAGDDREFERLTKANLVFPKPKVQLFWQGEGILRRIGNKDFSRGHLLSLKERIDAYRSLIANATTELDQLIDVVEWHQHGANKTRERIESLKLKYAETKVNLALLQKSKQAVDDELKEVTSIVNATKNATIDLPESLLKNEIVSLGATARARSQIAATIAVRKAMSHVTRAYKKYVKILRELINSSGGQLKLSTRTTVKGYRKAVKKISEDIKKFDRESRVLRTKASNAIRDAFLFRAKEKAAILGIGRARAGIRDEKRRYARVKKLHDQVRAELDKWKK